ncbi:arginase family protein [Ensifer sp. ENS06]|nr:arginase family protein [Ensifer sp. ENS06]
MTADALAVLRAVAKKGPVGLIHFDAHFDINDTLTALGTGTPEIGGFTTRQTQQLVRLLDDLRLVGADVFEVAPLVDRVGMILMATERSCSNQCPSWCGK